VAGESPTPSATPERPLAGLSVVVTRSREQSAALVEPLEALGAEVLAFPVIETADPEDWGPADAAIREIERYDWLVLTSTNGVDKFFARAAQLGRGPADLDRVRIAVVGSATAKRLLSFGVEPDLVPAEFHGEGLVESFAARGVGAGTRVLLARALEAREVLPERLREMGAEVDVVCVYRVVPVRPDRALLDRLARGVDVITFASGGTAKHFVEVLRASGIDADSVISSARVASVGPITTAALRSLGHSADIEAEESTMTSLVEAIVEDATRGEGR
jgi:uroporphyrinogen III methyltransferase/synthase